MTHLRPQSLRLLSRFAASILIGASLMAAPAMADHHAKKADKTIVETAAANPDFSTLVAAVKAADLAGTLSGTGPFTVFAPTNTAFNALPAGTVDTLLKPENKAQLTKVLTYHVVAGKVSAKKLGELIAAGGGSYKITTVSGDTLTATQDMGKIKLTDETGASGHVTAADLWQSNGVIHVVDKVVLPQ